ncbi:hypothetical protein NQZ68_002765 [Dissostichus eleginoides]|nr:hypothetical protein NQZ68_002765 [Dissostichus eleginoides]
MQIRGYDDGYGGEYDDDSYEAYEENYSNQAKSPLLIITQGGGSCMHHPSSLRGYGLPLTRTVNVPEEAQGENRCPRDHHYRAVGSGICSQRTEDWTQPSDAFGPFISQERSSVRISTLKLPTPA